MTTTEGNGREASLIEEIWSIHSAPGTGVNPEVHDSIEAIASRGLKADRGYNGEGSDTEQKDLEPSSVMLIEAEASAATNEGYSNDVRFAENAVDWAVTVRVTRETGTAT